MPMEAIADCLDYFDLLIFEGIVEKNSELLRSFFAEQLLEFALPVFDSGRCLKRCALF